VPFFVEKGNLNFMARFFTIASGSSGNSAYIGNSDAGILVDAGISCKGIVTGLCRHDIPLEQVKAIFITHEHIDHIRGLKVLLKKRMVPVFASAQVLDFLLANDCVPPAAQLEAIDGGAVCVAGMEIASFRTSHDSVHSLGYRIHTADDRLIGISTDLGFVSDAVKNGICGCDLVLMESNYEPNMLMNGAYPYYLKKRIAGQQGHLSNEDCAALLPELVQTGTTRIVLAHLSKENNIPDLAYQTSLNGLTAAQMVEGDDFILTVAKRSEAGEMMVL